MRTIKLSPSDFAFLLNECPRCYYNKNVLQLYRPSAPMAKIFNVIDKGMQEFLMNRPLNEISPELPNVVLNASNGFCTSEVIQFKDLDIQLYIHGRFDLIGDNLDIGGHVITDGKTSLVKPENIPLYSAQLHAYAFALSKPSDGSLKMDPIKRLGLLVFEPKNWVAEGENAELKGKLCWQNIDFDKKGFMVKLRQIAELLSPNTAPDPGENCSFCKYASSINSQELAPKQVSASV